MLSVAASVNLDTGGVPALSDIYLTELMLVLMLAGSRLPAELMTLRSCTPAACTPAGLSTLACLENTLGFLRATQPSHTPG